MADTNNEPEYPNVYFPLADPSDPTSFALHSGTHRPSTMLGGKSVAYAAEYQLVRVVEIVQPNITVTTVE